MSEEDRDILLQFRMSPRMVRILYDEMAHRDRLMPMVASMGFGLWHLVDVILVITVIIGMHYMIKKIPTLKYVLISPLAIGISRLMAGIWIMVLMLNV